MITTRNWIAGLTEDDLSAWASSGLLRRAYKVLPDTHAHLSEDTVTAEVRQSQTTYTVTIRKAGFSDIRCSCDAVGPCHHILAALLSVKAELPQVELETTSIGPWLLREEAERERQLGRRELRQATDKLKRGLPVSIRRDSTALIGAVTEVRDFKVRIPVGGGLAASSCDCGKPRCVHRAAVVLYALAEAGVCSISDLPDPPLDAQEKLFLDDIQEWLNKLLAVGLEQLSPALVEQGVGLAVRTRQNHFPKLGGVISHLASLLQKELDGQVAVCVSEVRDRLMDAVILIRALKVSPLPRPREDLTGVLRRDFFAVESHFMNCVGVQAWTSTHGTRGISLHLCDASQKSWYRYSIARPEEAQQPLSPHKSLKSQRLGGKALARLVGQSIHLQKGWLAMDGSLSGREGTMVEVLGRGVVEPVTDWQKLRKQLAQVLERAPLENLPRLPVVISPATKAPPCFNSAEQTWQQTVYDNRSPPQALTLRQQSPSSAWLQYMAKGVQNDDRIFGLLHWEHGGLCIQPLSIEPADGSPICHLSFMEMA